MTDKPNLTRVWASGANPADIVDPDVQEPGKFAAGWEAEIPPFEYFNFLHQNFTQALAHLNEHGIMDWSGDTDYPTGAWARSIVDNEIYISLQNPNGNQEPSASPLFWVRFRDYTSRANSIRYIDNDTGTTGEYVLAKTYPQQEFVLIDGAEIEFVPIKSYAFTKHFTLDVSVLLGQSVGTTIVPLRYVGGRHIPKGTIITEHPLKAKYSSTLGAFILDSGYYPLRFPKWLGPEVRGNQLPFTMGSVSAVTALAFGTANSAVAIAVADTTNGITQFIFNILTQTWVKVGNSLNIGAGAPGITSLGRGASFAQEIAVFDNGTDLLRTYEFTGGNWVQVGNSLNIPGVGASITALTTLNITDTYTDIAFYNQDLEQIRTYRWDGTDWTQIGNGFSVPEGDTIADIAALNGTDIAFVSTDLNAIKTYRWDGTDWTQLGDSRSLSSIGTPGVTALNSTDVVIGDSLNSSLRIFRFTGDTWVLVSEETIISTFSQYASLAAISGTEVAFVDLAVDAIRAYRFFQYVGDNPFNLTRDPV